jgi:hypothetical protein
MRLKAAIGTLLLGISVIGIGHTFHVRHSLREPGDAWWGEFMQASDDEKEILIKKNDKPLMPSQVQNITGPRFAGWMAVGFLGLLCFRHRRHHNTTGAAQHLPRPGASES